MSARVFYHSMTGNTRKVADAIASAVGCVAESVVDGTVVEPVDLLFLGAAVHGGDIDASVKDFIEGLDPAIVKQVTVFSTGFEQDKGKATGIMKDLLALKGIAVTDKCYFCRGRFLLFNRRHPNDQDLAGAEEFARSVLTK
ncbi:MAG: flavodoxin family protein [Candidatus Cryosericum sp.]